MGGKGAYNNVFDGQMFICNSGGKFFESDGVRIAPHVTRNT